MFSVIFPGQGSQIVGMGKEFYEKYDLVKKLFKEADEALNLSISKIIYKMVIIIWICKEGIIFCKYIGTIYGN